MKNRQNQLIGYALGIAVGGGLWIATGWLIWEWAPTTRWVETPATLRSVELESVRQSEDVTRQRVRARYGYEFDGVPHSSSDTLVATRGPFDARDTRLHERLATKFKAGEPTVCYVDPGKPTRSLLDRSPPYEDLTLLAAGHATFYGMLLLAWGSSGRPSLRVSEKQMRKHPREPWRWNPGWSSGVIRTETGPWRCETLGWLLLFGGFFAGFASIIAFSQRPGVFLYVMAGFMGLFLFAFAVGFIRGLVAWCWQGESVLRLNRPTGLVGGRLTATLRGPRVLCQAPWVALRLTCEEIVNTPRQRDRGSRMNRLTLWERTRYAKPTRDGVTRAEVPVEFVIPSDAESTNQSGRTIHWRLTAQAETPGVGYEQSFHVPVFKTAESQTGVESPPDEEPPTEELADPHATLEELLAADGIRQETTPTGALRYVAPPGRTPGYAVRMTVGAAVVFSAFVWITYQAFAHGDPESMFLYVFFTAGLWIFTLLILALPIGAVDAWLHHEDLTIEHDRWVGRLRWLGLPSWRRELLVSNLQRVSVTTGMEVSVHSTGSPRRPENHNVVADCLGHRRPVLLLRQIRNEHTARRLADELNRRLGGDDSRGDD